MKKTILIGLLFVLSGQVFGQEGPTVVVFNSPENKKEQLDLKTLVKFGMLEPFAGSFTFYFERVLTENFTAEVVVVAGGGGGGGGFNHSAVGSGGGAGGYLYKMFYQHNLFRLILLFFVNWEYRRRH